MKNIDKEPTYYVSLTEYNEVKRMFLKANDEINKLKDLLKECRECFELLTNDNSPWCPPEADTLLVKIKQVLGEE